MNSTFNVETLFGVDLPEDVNMALRFDYLSMRGPGVGLETDYDVMGDLFGLPARHRGESLLYYQYDWGDDNLGLGGVTWQRRTTGVARCGGTGRT